MLSKQNFPFRLVNDTGIAIASDLVSVGTVQEVIKFGNITIGIGKNIIVVWCMYGNSAETSAGW